MYFVRFSLNSLHLLPLLPSSHGNSYQITEPKTKANGEVCNQSSLYDFYECAGHHIGALPYSNCLRKKPDDAVLARAELITAELVLGD